jgi:predicted GIY-YIG superfamily endonuclease
MWYVYFLQLGNDDIYVGSTNDLKRRVSSLSRGQVASTRLSLPVRLRAYVAVETEAVARRLERYFKSGSGKAVAKKRFLQSI